MLYMQKSLILAILALSLALGWAEDETRPSAEETALSEEPAQASPTPEEVSTQADEARTLTRFRHPNLVQVSDYFGANNTAYIAMDYEVGEPRDALLAHHGTLTEAQLKRVLLPVADGLRQVHAAGFLHRDIKPSNIFVRRSDETPLELANLRAGTHDLALRHPHYKTVHLDGQRFTDGEVLRIERTLRRGVGKLTVLTTPRNAWVERDGERLASRTPVTLEGLPAGALQLTLSADGHRTAQVRAEVPKDGLGRLQRTLEPIVYGTLTLELVPADAAVTLPDIGPPYRPGMRLPEGRHRVVAKREGYADARLEVAVPGNGEARERIELTPLPQPFTVEASPATAQVRLMDRSEGYRAGMLLPWGEHRVEVSATGYQSKTETIRHGSSGPTMHRIELEKLFEVGRRFRDCPDCPELVVVPSGSFMMGSPSHEQGPDEDEGPVHRVRIEEPFAVGVYEVTVSEFGRFADGTGHSTGNSCWTYEGVEIGDRVGLGWRIQAFGRRVRIRWCA